MYVVGKCAGPSIFCILTDCYPNIADALNHASHQDRSALKQSATMYVYELNSSFSSYEIFKAGG